MYGIIVPFMIYICFKENNIKLRIKKFVNKYNII